MPIFFVIRSLAFFWHFCSPPLSTCPLASRMVDYHIFFHVILLPCCSWSVIHADVFRPFQSSKCNMYYHMCPITNRFRRYSRFCTVGWMMMRIYYWLRKEVWRSWWGVRQVTVATIVGGTKVYHQSLRITGILIYESLCADTCACPLVRPSSLACNTIMLRFAV